MNEDSFAGQWKQMRGELKSWGANSPMTTWTESAVRKTKLIGLVQEKYGYARDHETGAMDWILLWAFGIPIPILIGLFMVRGCT